MTEQEIHDGLKKEWATFSSQRFTGLLPEWFLSKFKEIVMEVPQNQLKYRADQLQAIISKDLHELQLDEVGMICNAYLDVEPKYIDKRIEVFVRKRIQIDSVRKQVNELEGNEMARLKRKEAVQMKMVQPRKPIIHQA